MVCEKISLWNKYYVLINFYGAIGDITGLLQRA